MMQPASSRRILFLLFALALSAISALAQTPGLYLVQKSQRLRQTSPTAVAPDMTDTFQFFARSPIEAIVGVPGKDSLVLSFDTSLGAYTYRRNFSTKAALDSAFPDGTYLFSGPGIPTASVTLAGSLYPPAPQLIGGSWNTGGMLMLNPTVENVLNFTPFVGFATSGQAGQQYAYVGAFNGTGAAGYFVSRRALSRPIPYFQSGGTQPLNSLTLSANGLLVNNLYYAGMEHITVSSFDTNSIPGSTVAAAYRTDLIYYVAALTSGTGGNRPVITQQPSNQTGLAGGSATFSFSSSSTGQTLVNWFVVGRDYGSNNGHPKYTFPGGRANMSVNSLTVEDSGGYFARLIHAGGITDTNAATLAVTASAVPTTIVSQPQGGTFRSDQSAAFAVAVSGIGPFQYAWYKDGQPIVGANFPSLLRPNLTLNDAGSYHVEVRSANDLVTSESANLVVQAAPQIVQQPLDATAELDLNASFKVVATGFPAPTIQWYQRTVSGQLLPVQNALPFSGANQSVLTVSKLSSAQDGLQFIARATNVLGVADSAVASIRLLRPSAGLPILLQSPSQVVRAGQEATFLIQMVGPGPFDYQWRKDGATLPGATNARFTIPSAASADAGFYSVIVRDTAGGSVTSNAAQLTVAGAVDDRFDPRGGPDGEVTEMISLRDGGFLITGLFTRVAGVPRAGLARLTSTGAVDQRFDPGSGTNGKLTAMVELAEGRFLLVGQFDRFNGITVPGLVRIDATGAVDSTFVPNLTVTPASALSIPALERFHYAAMTLPGGGYLLGGRAGLMALTASGTQRSPAPILSNAPVYALLQQIDGGILVGGDFTELGGQPRTRLARLRTDLSQDPSFNVGTGPDGAVRTLLRGPDGGIFAMGSFGRFNGVPRGSGIARFNPRGQLDLRFDPALQSLVARDPGSSSTQSVVIRPSAGRLEAIRAGRALLNGGLVVSNGPVNNQSVIALEPTGAVSPDVNVPVGGSANTVTVTDQGDVGTAGIYGTVGGTARNNVAVITDAGEGSRLINLSCRARVAPGQSPLILGFVIAGPDAMRVLIRGVGPSLANFGLVALQRPMLTLYNAAGTPIASNASWKAASDPEALTRVSRSVGAFDLQSDNDTALVMNLQPGAYTAHITGVDSSAGVALGELYAVDQGRSRLFNSAVRGAVGTGDDRLFPGFVVTGSSRLILMRAVGPTLSVFNIAGALQKPQIELRRQTSILAVNQGWNSGFDPAAVRERSEKAGAFSLPEGSQDSVLLMGLEKGDYTVVVGGADGGTGDALVEIYDAEAPDLPPLGP